MTTFDSILVVPAIFRDVPLVGDGIGILVVVAVLAPLLDGLEVVQASKRAEPFVISLHHYECCGLLGQWTAWSLCISVLLISRTNFLATTIPLVRGYVIENLISTSRSPTCFCLCIGVRWLHHKI